jgi:hypothetical protein
MNMLNPFFALLFQSTLLQACLQAAPWVKHAPAWPMSLLHIDPVAMIMVAASLDRPGMCAVNLRALPKQASKQACAGATSTLHMGPYHRGLLACHASQYTLHTAGCLTCHWVLTANHARHLTSCPRCTTQSGLCWSLIHTKQ